MAKCTICKEENERLILYKRGGDFIKVCESCEETHSNYQRSTDRHYIPDSSFTGKPEELRYWYYSDLEGKTDYIYPDGKKVVIVMEGGLIQDAYCTDKEMDLVIIDKDLDGIDNDDLAEYIEKCEAFDEDTTLECIY